MNEAVIGDLKHEKVGAVSKVSSSFDGAPVYFECEDLELEPAIEAFGSLWLIPCILSGRDLRFTQPVCQMWYQNALSIIDFLNENWGTNKIQVHADTVETQSSNKTASAVCFSGGVDTFHTVYKSDSPEFLVSVHPFDLPAASEETYQATRTRLVRVANAVNARPVTIRNNVLQHQSYKTHKLIDTFSGLLACLGHLLSQHISSLTVSPSFHKDNPVVYGGHYLLDPLFSSKNLKIHQPHTELKRRERVKAIADWPVAQENLFVCFNKQEKNQNCGKCEKCVRTLLDLHILGKLDSFKVFDQNIQVWEAIDQVKHVTWRETYEEALMMPLDPRIEKAIRRMLRRECERVWQLEDAARYRRHVDEEFATMKEALENALHHYNLLQENYDKLIKDNQELAKARPFRRGMKAISRVMDMLSTQKERHSK